MEVHQLRYLVAIARVGSITKAAACCQVAQPSLSQQIAKLEDEIGEPLLSRSARGAALTLAGEALVRRAERILKEIDEAGMEARDAAKLLRGTVSIGVIPTIAPYLLPAVLTTFALEHPGIELVLHEDTTAQLENKVANMELDIGIASLPLDETRLEVRTLFEEELLLALPRDHRLVKRKRVSLTDLESERLILMKEGHCLGTQALNFCHQVRLEPTVVLRSAQIETILALVASGMGISLIPKMAIRHSPDSGPVFIAVSPPVPRRAISVFHRKDAYLSRAALRMLAVVKSVAGGENPDKH